ncbi:MAG: mechanosensitive ion channel [Bacteroidales bacterium]|nr:mechanosensitive ion channel [Bacteroidales bacterium]
MENLWNEYSSLIVEYGTGLIYALLILLIGLWIVNLITKSAKKLMLKGALDISLVPFLTSLINIGLKIMVVISTLGMLGIEMTSFIALLGAAGLAVGMALSGTLQNFAGGVMILIFKPFKAGDFIDAQGHMGVVKEIQIFNTILTTGDNKTIIIPNGGLSTGAMVNFSTQSTRRVDWTFGIGYGDDADKAKKVLRTLLDADKRVLQDPEPFIALSELADISVNFVVRAWVNASDYWGVYFAMNENVYKTFEKEGLNIPYPQMDVHLDK